MTGCRRLSWTTKRVRHVDGGLALRWRTVAFGDERLRRLGMAIAVGLGLGFGLYQLKIRGFDGDAYWNAALRLRDGQPLYQPGTAADALVFRYPAWFAWLWTPATFLPHLAVMTAWRLAMVGATLALVPALWSSRWGRIGLVLFVPMLMAASWMGNVQPLVVALTVYGLRWSRGALAVGLAAGLKGLPLALVGVYLWRRDWRSAAVVMAVAGALWATALLYDLTAYPAVRGIWPTDVAILLALVPQRLAPTSAGTSRWQRPWSPCPRFARSVGKCALWSMNRCAWPYRRSAK
jgi:hypothetical protein